MNQWKHTTSSGLIQYHSFSFNNITRRNAWQAEVRELDSPPRIVNAKQIAKARKERGLSMQELARKAKVSPGTIHNLESGKFRPRGATLRKILQALQEVPKLPELE